MAAVIKTKSSLTSNAAVLPAVGVRAPHSHSAGFEVTMRGDRQGSREITVLRHLAVALMLVVAMAPAAGHAQVNIDEGKTPAHIFSSDCSVCHKSTRGLANGMDRSALSAFLAEHYTSSSDEAGAMAAYVLSGGGGETRATQETSSKPDRENPVARAEGPKGSTRQERRPAKPEASAQLGEQGPAAGRPKRPPGKPVASINEPETGRAPSPSNTGFDGRLQRGAAAGVVARHPPRESELEFAPPGPGAVKPVAPRDDIPD